MNKIIIILIILISSFFIFINTKIYKGKNMKCKKCNEKGTHFHLFPIIHSDKNHGKKIFNKYEENPCQICMDNDDLEHYHLI